MKVGLKMQNITYIIDKLLRNHIYKIIVIHWISYEPFEQPGPERQHRGHDCLKSSLLEQGSNHIE